MLTARRRSPALVLTCAALIVTIAMGVRQSFGLFMPDISLDLHVGRQAFGLAVALQNLVFGFAQPLVGALADRRGAGRIVAAGTLVYAAGLALTATIGGGAGLSLTLGLLIGLALSGTTFVVVFGPVARAVAPEHRSRALGLVTAGGSLGQFLVVPLAQAALTAFDWRLTFLLLGALAALMTLLAFGVSGAPSQAPRDEPRVSLRQAIVQACQSRDFWLLTAGFFVCGFHIAFVGTHLPAYLRDSGLPLSVGGWSLAVIGLFNIFGSYLFGVWGGRWPKARLLVALYALRSVTLAGFLLAPLSAASALAFAAAFGFLWLATVPLTSGLVGQLFGIRYLSTLYGLVFLSHQIGSFVGAWWAGQVFDQTGGYEMVWLVSIALALLAAALNLPVREQSPQMALG